MKLSTRTIWGIVFVVLFGALLIWSAQAKKSKEARVGQESSRDVALSCTTDMATQFHIHPKLSIIIDGATQAIPENIGVKNNCMNPLHTHDASGMIHVESPVQKDFTLGDFFAVWGKTFSKDQILDTVVTTPAKLTVRVNGTSVDTYENTIMNDKNQIEIEYKKN